MMSAMSSPAEWGPSHQTPKPWRPTLATGSLIAISVLVTVLTPATPVTIVVYAAWGVLVLAMVGMRASGRARQTRLLREATRASDPLQAVRAIARQRGDVYLGVRKDGDWAFSRPERAVLVLGPPRSGKTSAVIIPTLLCHPGPVVCTSTKPDVANQTWHARGRSGRLWVFDPTGKAGGGAGRLRWSPVLASGDWDGAMLMARAMSSAAHVGQGTTHSSHWANRSQALLAPLLHAAALDGRDMESVVEWVIGHELDQAGVLLEHEKASRLAFGSLLGIHNTEERERASIFSAAADAIQAYTSEAALEAAKDPNFSPREFVSSQDTIYIAAGADEQIAAAPVVCGLLAEIRRHTYRAFHQGRMRQNGRVLFALDEAANIAPLEELPQIASEGGSQGLILLAAFQDLSQARGRWGQAAEGFLTLFGTKLILPGIADRQSLETISTALGEYDRKLVATTTGSGAVTGRTFGKTVSTQRTRVLSPGEIANIPAGHGLYLDGLAWQLLTITPAHAGEPWQKLTAPALAAQ
jgi:type IV secretion system protein VirD4